MPPLPSRALPTAALAALVLAALPLSAQQTGGAAHPVVPKVGAVQVQGTITVDGVLGDATWAAAAPADRFTQQEPEEGRPATQRTEVRFAFDEAALYVAARMWDSEGAAGVRTQLVRRDQDFSGDSFQLVFDTFHDHAGRTVFTLNPSGVKGDAGQASPSADPSWDPVWQAATRIDSAGWTAELRIPWSQLRFSSDTTQTWGLQVWRYVERINERSMWSFWGKQEAGGPARFGHLEGIRITERPRGWEVMPYAVARASRVRPTQPGSPFQSPRDYGGRVGADFRALLGSNLTLSGTVNPDFGQVEQDPAVVNLSAFESYFEEKRPFFVEGSGLLSFGGLSCFTCSNVSGMSLFYSRRIGRAPQGALGGGYEFVERPRNSRLLGAAKLTGRTGGGWQIGALEAVTAREVARVQTADGLQDEVAVEPMTNYLMGRVRRVTAGGSRTWGLMATSVVRRFGRGDEALRTQLPTHAEALGADWNLYWKNQTYRLMGNVAFSSVQGDSLAVGRLQRSPARYFQRPDRGEGENGVFSRAYDTGAEALRGWGGYLRLSREGGPWRWETSLNVRSPGFEVNDMAFLSRADYAWMNANLGRQWARPTSWYRSVSVLAGAQQQLNFDGDRTDLQFHSFAMAELPNLWEMGVYAHVRPEVDDDRATRGAGVVRRAASWFVGPRLSTDSRRAVSLSVNPGFGGTEDGGRSIETSVSVRWRPTTSVQLSLGPSYNYSRGTGQYVGRFDDPSATHFHGQRVVFAEMEQRTLAMNTRVSWTFTPTLTMELFAQPFVATGDFRRFREFTGTRTLAKRDFDAGQLAETPDGAGQLTGYTLDPDRDAGTRNFSFGNPDFNFRSLRGNAVVRWEYRPGSTLFFVWQQERSGFARSGDFAFERDAAAVFRQHPDNVFVVKASYWLGR